MVKTVILDCSKLLTRDQAHPYLAQVLALPDYYGGNLDALYDCLTEIVGLTISLEGAPVLRSAGGYGAHILQVLEDAAAANPGLCLTYRDGGLSVRLVQESDAPALLAIYGQYIDTSITFEYTLPTADMFAERIRNISRTYPYLVLEHAGQLIGYAYAHRAREWDAYDWLAELSVYLDQGVVGQGLGKRLYSLLIDLLRLQGVKTAMGCVTVPNAASEALHASLGFVRVGLSHQSGYKNGAWHDVAWFEKPLAPYDVPPAPLVPFRDVDPLAVAAQMVAF